MTRSLALCESLADDFEVDMILGGPEIPRQVRNPSLKIHPIDPLLMREEDSSLYSPQGRLVEEVFDSRHEKLMSLAKKTFDVVVTELFPFGRGKFKHEILSLIENVKTRNPRTVVASSLRDILVESSDDGKKNRRMVDLAQKHFDWIFVHSDPDLIKLEETFPLAQELSQKLVYTGFVTESRGRHSSPVRENRVLVSLGGGSVGRELMEGFLNAAKLMPELEFSFVLSPYLPEDLKNQILVEERSQKNIHAKAFSSEFEQELLKSSLSVSMGGYNTVMNVLNTQTPALIYCYDANQEQRLRAQILEKNGFLTLLEKSDLSQSQLLVEKVKNRLKTSFPSEHPVQLKGSEVTAEFLKKQILKGTN